MHRLITPTTETDPSQGEILADPLRVWGLTAGAAHDAYWSARGVQCIRRGEGAGPDRSADIYLLLEPGQMAIFELGAISEELQWTRARICRVRVLDAAQGVYRERVVTGEDGLVKRIARLYGSDARDGIAAGERVLLTESADVAAVWHGAASRRAAWLGLRRLVPLHSTIDVRTEGRAFRAGVRSDEEQLFSELAKRWVDPERAIDGIVEVMPGVFGMSDAVDSMANGSRTRLVGPLWLGNARVATGTVLIGPKCLPDDASTRAGKSEVGLATVRPIHEVLSPEARRASARSAADTGFSALLKRPIDIVVSAMVLLLASPILAVVAIAVVLDDGFPIFFGHRRQTRGGRIFRCMKFRTMRRNAEALARELRDRNVCDGPQFFIQDDPRVTRVGKFLRRWHLDEVPQFWNVLRGEMSLVGPRPSPEGENQFCPAWRELRLSVRPGITGLWQVERTRESGRDFQEWIKYDIEYVQRASLALDFLICWKTFQNLVRRSRHG